MEQKIGLIGAGNMAEAIIGAIVHLDLVPSRNIFASDIREDRLIYLQKMYGITPCTNNIASFSNSDIIFLAVKPQQMEQVLLDLASAACSDIPSRKLIISIAAGVKIQKIESILYKALSPENQEKMPIIRAMPNTPALVLKGMTGIAFNRHTTAADLENGESLLNAMGKVLRFEEEDLDAVTALSGSGPAYVFLLAELMIKAGIQLGLPPDHSKTLALATIEGAMALMSTGNDSPEALRAKVTSPGGTTAAAIQWMTDHQVHENIVTAIVAAARRSRELSN